MRLVLMTQDFPPEIGGIQTWSGELARRFAERCERFTVLAPALPDGLRRGAGLPGVETVRASGASGQLPWKGLAPLRRLLRRERFDVVLHAQWPTRVASAAAQATGWRGKTVVACHGRELLLRPFEAVSPAQRAYDALRARLLRDAEGVLAVSHYTGQLAVESGARADRVRVVPNGADVDHFRPVSAAARRDALGLADRRVVVSVGRLVRRKGFDTVIQALARLPPDVVYVCVGAGEDRERLEALARSEGVADRVRFQGRVPYGELAEWYSLGDVFAMPARLEPPCVEGFGITYLEANACGRPVVACPTGGVPDAVVHGETGLLVPPSDPAALAEALGRLLDDSELAARLGEQGMARARRDHTWDAAFERAWGALVELTR